MVELLANSQKNFIHFLRISIFIVMAWIGGLKAFHYEAEGIVPFVANSSFMSFMLNKKVSDTDNYKLHKNKEGEVISENVKWHKSNGSYTFSYGLGTVIVLIGILVLLGIFSPKIGLIGGILTAGMSLVTLSFLVTTPEVWVPNLGGNEHGFPLLSGSGRMVLKDIMMMAGGFIIASDSAKSIVLRKK
jgi:reactive chlorine resistance protein C